MDRQVTAPKRATLPTWVPLSPRKQAIKSRFRCFPSFREVLLAGTTSTIFFAPSSPLATCIRPPVYFPLIAISAMSSYCRSEDVLLFVCVIFLRQLN